MHVLALLTQALRNSRGLRGLSQNGARHPTRHSREGGNLGASVSDAGTSGGSVDFEIVSKYIAPRQKISAGTPVAGAVVGESVFSDRHWYFRRKPGQGICHWYPDCSQESAPGPACWQEPSTLANSICESCGSADRYTKSSLSDRGLMGINKVLANRPAQMSPGQSAHTVQLSFGYADYTIRPGTLKDKSPTPLHYGSVRKWCHLGKAHRFRPLGVHQSECPRGFPDSQLRGRRGPTKEYPHQKQMALTTPRIVSHPCYHSGKGFTLISMVKFLHTADWQIGMARHYLDQDAQARFSAARLDAIEQMATLAVNEQCEFVVVCGDVFESNQVQRQVLVRSFEEDGRFPSAQFLPAARQPRPP